MKSRVVTTQTCFQKNLIIFTIYYYLNIFVVINFMLDFSFTKIKVKSVITIISITDFKNHSIFKEISIVIFVVVVNLNQYYSLRAYLNKLDL